MHHPLHEPVGMLDCIASLCWKLIVQVLNAIVVPVYPMLMPMVDCYGVAM